VGSNTTAGSQNDPEIKRLSRETALRRFFVSGGFDSDPHIFVIYFLRADRSSALLFGSAPVALVGVGLRGQADLSVSQDFYHHTRMDVLNEQKFRAGMV
jgi:hypothetical protein